MKLLPVATLLVLALAGCSESTGQDSGRPVASTTSTGPGGGLLNNTTAPAAPPVTYTLTGCDQMHTFFPFPYQAIVPPLPPGFTPVLDASGQVADVFVNAGVCESGEIVTPSGNVSWDDAGEMQLFIPVNAPPALRDATVTLDLVPLVGYADSEEVLTQLLNWSFNGPFGAGKFQLSPGTPIGPGLLDQFSAETNQAAYVLRTVVQVAAGPEFNAVYRAWLINAGSDPSGHLRITVTAGKNVGAGAAEYQVQTAPTNPIAGGPPQWPGTGHRVNDANVFVQFIPWSDAEG